MSVTNFAYFILIFIALIKIVSVIGLRLSDRLSLISLLIDVGYHCFNGILAEGRRGGNQYGWFRLISYCYATEPELRRYCCIETVTQVTLGDVYGLGL